MNSVNGEEKQLATVPPIVKARGAAVIGLTLADEGIPSTAEERLAAAAKIIERATKMGIPIEDIIIDESLDVTRIYSVADQLPAGTPLIRHQQTISHFRLMVNIWSPPAEMTSPAFSMWIIAPQ
ncbi:MAG: hypothetical protein ACXW4M_15010 [Anaerolineales bacterium]